MAAVLKTAMGATSSWVRIPRPPLESLALQRKCLPAGMRPEFEDQDAEILVHPLLLVRVAALSVLRQLRLDGGLDPEPCRAEHVDQIGDGVGAFRERDLLVP